MSSLSPERRAAVLRRKAWTYAETKQPDAAIEAIDDAIAALPDDAGCHLDKVDILLKLGRPQDALAAADQALVGAGRVAALLARRGDALRRLQRTNDAIDAYEQAIGVDPTNHHALSQLGNALAEAGRFPLALEAFDHLAAASPRDAEAQLCRGLVLAKLERYREGLEAIDLALDLDPKLWEAYLQRARLLRRAGKLDAAAESADVCVQKLPRYVESYVLRADIALEQTDLDTAFAMADKAQRLDASDPQVWRIKSVAHARAGRAAAATVCRALHLLLRGEGEAALVEVDAALGIEPEFVHAWHQRGVILEALGRLDDAEKSYRKAIELDDGAVKALRDLGLLLGDRLDRLPEALPVLSRAVALDAKIWQTLPTSLQKRVNKPAYW